jgi:hypothetical protein
MSIVENAQPIENIDDSLALIRRALALPELTPRQITFNSRAHAYLDRVGTAHLRRMADVDAADERVSRDPIAIQNTPNEVP